MLTGESSTCSDFRTRPTGGLAGMSIAPALARPSWFPSALAGATARVVVAWSESVITFDVTARKRLAHSRHTVALGITQSRESARASDHSQQQLISPTRWRPIVGWPRASRTISIIY